MDTPPHKIAPKEIISEAVFEKVRVETKKPENFVIDESINDSIKILNDIYRDIRVQTKLSFIFSLAIVGLGFITLLIAVYVALQGFQTISIITITCAALLEFIGATSLIIHARLVTQQQFFGEKIVKTQDSAFADIICSKIESQEVRDNIRGMITIETVTRNGSADYMLSRKPVTNNSENETK